MSKTTTSSVPTAAPLLLKPREAAMALAVSPRKLWELTNTGELPCVRIGRAVRYDVRDLIAWIDKQKNSRNRRNFNSSRDTER